MVVGSPLLRRQRTLVTWYACRLPPDARTTRFLGTVLLCLTTTMPLSAVAVVPSIVAVQLLSVPLREAWILEIVPFATPLLYDVPLRGHGKSLACRLYVRPAGPVQLAKVTFERVASGLVSPLPLLAVPAAVEDVHVSTEPILVSVRTIRFDTPERLPPGVTVQVLAVDANTDVALRLIAKAVAPLAVRMVPRRLRIGIDSSSADVRRRNRSECSPVGHALHPVTCRSGFGFCGGQPTMRCACSHTTP